MTIHAAGHTEAQIGLEYDIIRRQVRYKYLNTNANTNTNTNTKIKIKGQANLDRDQMRGYCKYDFNITTVILKRNLLLIHLNSINLF